MKMSQKMSQNVPGNYGLGHFVKAVFFPNSTIVFFDLITLYKFRILGAWFLGSVYTFLQLIAKGCKPTYRQAGTGGASAKYLWE